MQNLYSPPKSRIEDLAPAAGGENNSGSGRGTIPPAGVRGWSWGAFFLSWIWAAFNKTWVGLLALTPYAGFLVSIYLGIQGRELAWRNKRWDSLEHFNRVQRRWSIWGTVMVIGTVMVGILAAIALPGYRQYIRRHTGG